MRSVLIAISVAIFATFLAPRAWAGEFDGLWEANIEVEPQYGKNSKHSGTILIINNSFDSRVFDKDNYYSMMKGDIAPNGEIQSGYFMWGNKSSSCPMQQGRFTSTSATLRGSKGVDYFTVKLTRISDMSSPGVSAEDLGDDEPVMERPKIVVGDTWTEMDYDYISGDIYTKQITKVTLVNEDGSFEMETEVPELGHLYYGKKDKQHRYIGGKEKNSGTVIPGENPEKKYHIRFGSERNGVSLTFLENI